MEYPLDTEYVQYQAGPSITRLLLNTNAYLDPRPLLDRFYDLIWNPKTAVGYGLDVWGRIVGVTRVIPVTGTPFSFGFNDGVADYGPFGQAPFYSGQRVTTNYALTDDAFRALVFTRALSNISGCAAPDINAGLALLFAGRGRAYVNDLGGMTMRYTFEFPLLSYEVSIVTSGAALLRPTGVDTKVLIVPTPGTFGFNGSGCEPFGQGTFLPSGAYFDAG